MPKTQSIGTVLKQGSTVVASLTAIGPPSTDRSEVPTTSFDSTLEETLPGLINAGEMAVSGFYVYTDAGQTILRADGADPAAVAKAWTIENTKQAMKLTFSGWVKRFNGPNPNGPNDAYTFDAVIRLTTIPVAAALP